MSDNIQYLVPWKCNTFVRIVDTTTTYNPWSDIQYNMELVNTTTNAVILSVPLDPTRQCIGVYPNPTDNTILVCHTAYIGSTPYMFAVFYRIDIEPVASITRISLHKAKSPYSCGGMVGKVCPSSTEPGTFYIWFGNLINYRWVSVIEVNVNNCSIEKRIEYNTECNPDFENVFLLDTNSVIYSEVMGHYQTVLEIALFTHTLGDDSKSNCFCLTTANTPNAMTFDFGNDTISFDSKVFDFFQWNGNLYCLLRAKLYQRINVISITPYFLDLIIQIDGSNSTVVDMSPPIYYPKEEDYLFYFGKRPYWTHGENGVKVFTLA